MKKIGKMKLYTMAAIIIFFHPNLLSHKGLLNPSLKVYASTKFSSVSEEGTVNLKVVLYDELLESVIASSASLNPNLTEAQKCERQYRVELLSNVHLPYFDTNKVTRYLNYKKGHQDVNWDTVITRVNIGLDNEYYSNVQMVSNPSSLDVLINKYNQLPSDYVPPGLTNVGGDQYLRGEAAEAFEQMRVAAKETGEELWIADGYRSYNVQDEVYWRKIRNGSQTQEQRDRVSARAGHTEHQTGLAVDVNSVEESHFAPEGRYYGVRQWLEKNAHKHGFIVRYPEGKENITGYNFEPWHLRFVGVELATAIFESGLTLDEYDARGKPAINIQPNVAVDNETIQYARGPIMVEGTSYLPLKETCGLLGYNVIWDASTKKTCISNGYITYEHVAGTNEFFSANKMKMIIMEDPTFVADGMVYIPARGICGLAGAQIEYNGLTKTIYVTPFEKTKQFSAVNIAEAVDKEVGVSLSKGH